MLDDKTGVEYVYTNENRERMYIFEIHSTPRPQKQTQFSRYGCFDPSKNQKISIQWQIRPHSPKEPLLGCISLCLTFYLPIPKHIKGIEREQMINGVIKPYKRPDVDNLAYIVTNAMKGIVYKDDSQICDMTLLKRYSESPKTVIKVCEI